jgi:regulatory protein YycH of two-component signal transduction system YycFG
MTSTPNQSNYGPPPPVLELTLEQKFKLRQIEDALKNTESAKEDIITVFMALQRQNFILSNSLTNLLKHWPTPTQLDLNTIDEVLSKFGISSETKD